ncbi:MAG: MarR family transcriptional regulator [Leptospiraceae bacterium]|nr:MarR family transcriptional regulator [Leptospiraceae bacterium]
MKKVILPPNEEVQKKIFTKIKSENNQSDLSLLNCITEIIQFSTIVSNSFELHFSRYKLSQPGFLTIMLLYSDNENDWTAIRLAKELGVKPPTMTGILDTLEKNDFIERTPSKEDRRVIQVTLSKNGIKQIKKILPDHLQRISSAFQSFDENLQTKQQKVFSTILDSLETLNRKES